MSGSGGGFSTFNDYSNRPSMNGGVTVDGEKDQCNLRFTTQLSSPNPDLVKDLSVGDILIVAFDENKNLVTAQNSNLEAVGTIAPPNLSKLIDCIQQGNEYVATITKMNGGYITVEVHLNL